MRTSPVLSVSQTSSDPVLRERKQEALRVLIIPVTSETLTQRPNNESEAKAYLGTLANIIPELVKEL